MFIIIYINIIISKFINNNFKILKSFKVLLISFFNNKINILFIFKEGNYIINFMKNKELFNKLYNLF